MPTSDRIVRAPLARILHEVPPTHTHEGSPTWGSLDGLLSGPFPEFSRRLMRNIVRVEFG
jgi:hypothetical protein